MTLRLIQAGLGGWGRDWAVDVVRKNSDVETVAWVEIDDKAREQAQQLLKLPAERCFATLEEALAVYDAEAVLVTASLPGHVPVATSALKAGKHVLLEKPFAPSVEEATEVVALAEQQKRILMISQNYRFYPAVRKVVELVKGQTLGPINVVNIDFRKYANSAPITNRHYHIRHPLLLDMSIHHFDLMRLVIQKEPKKVVTTPWNPSWSHFDDPPAASVAITFEDGVIVNYRGSWISTGKPTSWAGEWHIECEKGEIIWSSRGDDPENVLLRHHDGTVKEIELPELPVVDRRGSLAAFVEAVKTGTEPETSGRRNLNTLALMFAAIESAESEQAV